MPARLTRLLCLCQENNVWICPTGLTPHLMHLGGFTNVTLLAFTGLVTASFPGTSLPDYFRPFATRMKYLRLKRPITRPTSLVQIILLFPAVVDIKIENPRWCKAKESEVLTHPPAGAPGFTGELTLHGFGERWLQFFMLLSEQPLQFRRTTLSECHFSPSAPVQSLLGAVSCTTRTLLLGGSTNRELSCGLRRNQANCGS